LELPNKFPGKNKELGMAKGKHSHLWFYVPFDPIKYPFLSCPIHVFSLTN
jgi:hypothetical protein